MTEDRIQRPVLVPDIETPRLILRQLNEDDIDFIFEMFSRDETNRYVADDNITTMEEARQLFEDYCRPKPYLFRLGIVLKDTGRLVGTLGFYGIKPEDSRAVLGTDLLKEFWGQGIMTEAVLALLKYGFEEMGLNRIQASADADNARSLRLIERTGFTKEGVMRQKDFYKGAFHDDILYSYLREEWQARQKNRINC